MNGRIISLALAALMVACGGSTKSEPEVVSIEQKVAQFMERRFEAYKSRDVEEDAEVRRELQDWLDNLAPEALQEAEYAIEQWTIENEERWENAFL